MAEGDGMVAMAVGTGDTMAVTVATAAITAATAIGDGLSSALESDFAGIIQVTLITDTRLTVIPMSMLSRRTVTLQLRFIARRSQSPLLQLRQPDPPQRRSRLTLLPSQLMHPQPDPHRNRRRLPPR